MPEDHFQYQQGNIIHEFKSSAPSAKHSGLLPSSTIMRRDLSLGVLQLIGMGCMLNNWQFGGVLIVSEPGEVWRSLLYSLQVGALPSNE
jgi:hypothetical protein